MQTIKYAILLIWFILPSSESLAQSLPVTANLRIWLDAKDITNGGTQPADGAIITSWRDKSGNNYTANSSGTTPARFEIAGLNGLPSVRLEKSAKFQRSTIFPTANSNETTIFIVNSSVKVTNNYFLNLNGDNTGSSGTTARFSLNLPWTGATTPDYIFDAGGCCGSSTRLRGSYPVSYTTPVIVVAGNSINPYPGMGVNRFVRFNGATLSSDTTAIAPRVSGGFRLGATSFQSYDGRASEVIIYNRALSLDEIRQVECYLGGKWLIDVSQAGCTPISLAVIKASTGYPGNSHGDLKLPQSDLIYSVDVNYQSGNMIDTDSVVVIDPLPQGVIFYNGDYDGPFGPGADPIGFNQSNTGLIWNYATAVRYSNSTAAPTSFAACTYTPIVGYDPDVRHICIKPTGMSYMGNFTVSFRAQIR